MPTRRFERITVDQILLSGCAIVFGACILIKHAQAQPGYVPPPTPLPVFNPSRCRNRPTGPSRRQHQAPFPEMWLPRQRAKACRKCSDMAMVVPGSGGGMASIALFVTEKLFPR